MNNKKLFSWLVVLIIVAAAVVVYMQTPMTSSPAGTTSSSTTPKPNLTNPNPADATTPGQTPTAPANVTKDEKAALSSFSSSGDSSTQVEKANTVAKETGSIDVTNCAFNPVVLKVKSGTNFTLKNTGGTEVVVTYYADNISHPVPALGSVTVKADFANHQGGLFGFYCRAGSTTHESATLVY